MRSFCGTMLTIAAVIIGPSAMLHTVVLKPGVAYTCPTGYVLDYRAGAPETHIVPAVRCVRPSIFPPVNNH